MTSLLARRGGAARGFTLMELLLAVFIFGFIALTVYGVLSRAIYARTVAEERAELYALGRETLLKIADDVEGALLPLYGDRIYFKGTAQPPSLEFVATNRGGYGEGRVRPGLVILIYQLNDPDPRGYRTLIRGEVDLQSELEKIDEVTYGDDDTRFDLNDSNDVQAPTELFLPLLDCPPGAEESGIAGACARVVGMRFRFYDDAVGDWREYWDSFEIDSLFENRIPDAVEIVLVLLDEKGGEHEFFTVVDLPLARANPTPGAEEDLDDPDDPANDPGGN